MKILSTIILLLCVNNLVNCASIFAITPALDINYKRLYLPLWRELANRGHFIFLVTTVEMEPHDNITLIDVSQYYVFKNNRNDSKHPYKTPTMLELMAYQDVNMDILNHPFVNALKLDRFKLVFIELGLPFWPSLPALYRCPFIGINNRDANPLVHYHQGNAMHPYMYPKSDRYFALSSIEERCWKVLDTLTSFILAHLYQDRSREFMYKVAGVNLPDSTTMYKNMSLMFVNVNPIFDEPRPMVPRTINLGGFLSIKEPEELPRDLQKYLDDSKKGCIYVSFGTTVNSEYLSKEQKDILVNVFKKMAPMRILWKFDDLNVAKGVPNVEVRNWVPQQDILRHPNVKLFITQGGLQSMEEAIDSAVPMLGMPFYGDQVNNVNKMHHKKFGLRLQPKEMNEVSLRSSLEELLNNPIYKKNIDKFSAISKDRPMKGLEKAVWWTEYVLRHGTEHLRSPSADIPLYQYFFLDVIAFFIVSLYGLYILTKYFFRITCFSIRYLYGAVRGKKEKRD